MPHAKCNAQQPMQPIELAEDGIIRFKPNALVVFLLHAGPFDMNRLALLPDISREDRAQFAQLVGYSVSGYGDLGYALGVAKADRIAAEITKKQRGRTKQAIKKLLRGSARTE